jgi:hypothetical protein
MLVQFPFSQARMSEVINAQFSASFSALRKP